ncbi:MAG TPA: MMPL family transporter [Kofleriaceae bacterium]|nr:MMPL family transporter [Kofleriaceae bacterium]
MTQDRKLALARRYTAWLRRNWALLTLVGVVTFAVSTWLAAFRLPLHGDLSHLLPPDAPAVRDLRTLEGRVVAQDAMLVLVVSKDPAARSAAAAEMAARAKRFPPELVSRVEDDDQALRDYIRARRHLFVPLDELTAARDALAEKIEHEKLLANPLYLSLDEDEAQPADASGAALEELRAKRREAEAKLDRSGNLSADGETQLVVLRTPFPKTDVERSRRLHDLLVAERAQVMGKVAGPGIELDIGFAGGTEVTLTEHDSLRRGIVLSSLVTAVLVGLVLILYFRSTRLLLVLGGTLIGATTIAFGVAVFTVGSLNAATAFLGAIIAGNGVNYGILLIARYLEERRRHAAELAMAHAIAGTLRPTLVASFGAAIAYGSLAATAFRGFSDFAIIGSVGMLVCWAASYTILPALVLRVVPSARMSRESPVLGGVLARILGFRHPQRVLAVAGVLAVAAGFVTYRYVAADPFEYNIRNLRSAGKDAISAREWMTRSDVAFGKGIGGQTYVAVDSLDEVRQVVRRLEGVERPWEPPAIGRVRSILEVMPEQQPEKLAVLAEIRTLLDDDALEALDDETRNELLALRPPDDLAAITPEHLPAGLVNNLRERDGRVGLIVGIRPDLALDEWNGKDLLRFAHTVRRVHLDDGSPVVASGSSVVFADILEAIQHDGVKVTALAALGLLLMVLLVVGADARAVAVLVATAGGGLGMVALCALFDLKVNFLDFVALPITLGLGVDYAINVAHRHREGGDPVETLRTSGSAVFVCSMTTIIGYGSLLASENLAIRGFGLASLIGEVSCLLTALVLVPAIVSLPKRRRCESADRAHGELGGVEVV